MNVLISVCESFLVPAKVMLYSLSRHIQEVPLSKQYGKPELYYRLLAPYLLPEEMERILYLDADIIINGSLREFYQQSIDGAYAAFVMDRFYFCDEVQTQKKI